MRRRDVRKNTFNLLFQIGFNDNVEETKNIFFQELEMELIQSEKDFILNIVDGVIKNIEDIDNIINNVAKKWNTSRMSKVDLTILRLAVYEIKFDNETPKSIVINEAVELAKKYSSDNAPSFINGILGKID